MSEYDIIKGSTYECLNALTMHEKNGYEVYIMDSHYDQDSKELILIIEIHPKMLNE